MKKFIIPIILFIVMQMPASAQLMQDSIPAHPMNDRDLGTLYLQKSKQQNTIAWLMLGGGLAAIVGGSVIATNEVFNDGSSNGGAFMCTAGILSCFGSIPMFASGARNKGRAEILLKSERIPFSFQKTGKKMTELGIAFKF